MKKLLLILAIACVIYPIQASSADYPLPEMDPESYPAPNTGCLAPGKCHAGIEPIRAHDSGMAKQIYAKGKSLGDPKAALYVTAETRRREKMLK